MAPPGLIPVNNSLPTVGCRFRLSFLSQRDSSHIFDPFYVKTSVATLSVKTALETSIVFVRLAYSTLTVLAFDNFVESGKTSNHSTGQNPCRRPRHRQSTMTTMTDSSGIRTIKPSRRRLRHAIGLLPGFFLAIPSADARKWTDIVDPQDMTLRDPAMAFHFFEEDPFLFMETSTQPPLSNPGTIDPQTSVPPLTGVNSPGPSPSSQTDAPETWQPTPPPTNSPTSFRTASPSANPYPENPVPSSPPSSYFNYDPSKSNPYGPGYPELQKYNETTLAVMYENNGWAQTGVPDDFYWDEFDDERGFGPWRGVLGVRSPERNRCDRIGDQSPIDIRPSGAECYEHHQIRIRVS